LDNKGSITIATIIIFSVFLPLLLYSSVFGIRYSNQLSRCLHTTQHAADSIEACVVSYDPNNNKAVFDDISEIEAQVESIVNGNLGIENNDISKSFVGEIPIIEVYVHNEILNSSETYTYEGKTLEFKKPGVAIVVKYPLKHYIGQVGSSPTITVVRKYEII
jgi:hypothetical protein